MADGGGSSASAGASSAGAAASSDAGAAQAAASTSESAGAEVSGVTEGKSAEAQAAAAEDAAGSVKVSEKVGEVIADKAVTVADIKEKTTIDKDHVEGEEKVEKKEEVKKHKYADRLAKAFPGREYASDEDYEVAHEEHVTALESYKERGTIANQKLVALFDAEPQIADVVVAMINGATLRSALARHIGSEDLVPEEGDPDYSEYDKNNKERLERIDKTNKFNQEFNENVEFSRQSVDSFATENNLKPEEAEKILGEFDDMLKDIYRGRITKETLTKIMRAVTHDEAVKEAKEEAKIEGRNEAIKEKIGKEEKTAKDDGMPNLSKTGDTVEEDPTEIPAEVQFINKLFNTQKKRSNF